MSKFIVGLAFDSLTDATAFLNFAATLNIPGAAAPVTLQTPAAQPPQPQPQWTPPPVGFGAPPPAQPAPAGFQPQPAPSGFQPQPQPTPGFQPQPTPAAAPGGYTLQTVLPLMQKYIATFKAPGAMAAFAKFGLPPTLPQLDQNGLNTMGAFFAAMQPA